MYFQRMFFYSLTVLGSMPKETMSQTCINYCPPGWKPLLGGGTHCYLLPPVPIPLKSFWDMQNFCKSQQPTAYIITLNSLAENFGAGIAAVGYFAQYIAALGNFFIWLGAYYSNGAWHWLDGSPWSYNVMFANPFNPPKNATCAYVDPKSTLVTWSYRPCSDMSGATACEMPPLQNCGVPPPTTTTPAPYGAPTCVESVWADYTKHASTGYMATSEMDWLTGLTLDSCSVACTYYVGCLSFDFDAVTGDCRLLQASSALTCNFVDDPVGDWQHYDLLVRSAY